MTCNAVHPGPRTFTLSGMSQWDQALDVLKVAGPVAQAAVLVAGYRFLRSQWRERAERDEAVLDVRLTPRVFNRDPRASGGSLVLQSAVEVTNKSNRTWVVAAAYVSARALCDVDSDGQKLEGVHDFDALPPAGTLSHWRNVARVEKSIVQVGPGETEQFIRWDFVSGENARLWRSLVVGVEVFCASHELLGQKHGRGLAEDGPQRENWINLMDRDDGVRHRYVVFRRAPTGTPGWNARARMLALPPPLADDRCGDVDPERSAMFRDVLGTVVAWTRQETVALRPAPSSEPSHEDHAEVAAGADG